MTDEEMAEEYADRTRIVDENTRAGTDCISLVQDYEGNVIDIHERIKQAFLAGLKAGRPKWHDLRKDPNDLPEESSIFHEVLNQNGTKVFYDDVTKKWNIYCGAIVQANTPIAWCEIPKYTEE